MWLPIGHKRDIGYDGGYTLQPVCARPAEKARSPQHPMCPINFRWEETYTPTMHSASLTLAHNALHSPSYSGRLYVPCYGDHTYIANAQMYG